MAEQVTFTPADAQRIANTVTAYEKAKNAAPVQNMENYQESALVVVQVTGTINGNFYPGKIYYYESENNTYTEGDSVLIKEVGSRQLVINYKYLGKLHGTATASGLLKPVVLVNAASGGGTPGVSSIQVVTGISCGANGIEATYATLTNDEFTTVIMKQFLGLTDVIPKTFAGCANRQVIVDENETGLTFGPVLNKSTAVQDFLGLSDTPNTYSGQGGKLVQVNSTGTALIFGNIVTANSVTGGTVVSAIQLVNDASSPGSNKYYGTDASGVKGWFNRQITSNIGTITNSNIGNTLDETNLTTLAAGTLAKLTALETKVNQILTALRNHGLINP